MLSPSESWAAGAIVATPGDVAAFFDGLFTGALLDPAGLALLTDGIDLQDVLSSDNPFIATAIGA